jgi:S-adenosylmethionine-dependent methyltransferase
MKQDKNFDPLIDRFERKVYATDKGQWRLKLLKEDLLNFTQHPPMTVWDAGCGFAQISRWLAEHGHHLTLCDISRKMLSHAQAEFEQAGLNARFHHQPAQTLAAQLPDFDLILFHAVLEWLADPLQTLKTIAAKVKPGGHLSLLFYNRNAMVYHNALKGGWRLPNLLNESYIGKGHRLTPPNPHYPHEIVNSLTEQGFKVIRHTGIRVFHDYLPPDALAQTDKQQLFDLEYRYCRLPTYRDMGRYVHLLLHRQQR